MFVRALYVELPWKLEFYALSSAFHLDELDLNKSVHLRTLPSVAAFLHMRFIFTDNLPFTWLIK